MLREMPCSKGHAPTKSAGAAPKLTGSLKPRIWFESAEVEIEIPELLWLEFEEMPALLRHQTDPRLSCTSTHEGLLRAHWQKKKVTGKRWLGRCHCKSCCCMLQLRWYVEHGAVIKTVHRTIGYRVTKFFTWFVE